MKTIILVFATFMTGTVLWAQGSGGSHGASPPIPYPGMDPITTRIIQGGDLSPGRRAPLSSDVRLPGLLEVRVNASEPWPHGPRPSDQGLKRVLAAFADINTRYGDGLRIPSVVNLRFLSLSGLEGEWLSDTGYGIPPTRYDVAREEITAGEALGSTQGALQSAEGSLTVMVHEYGHALFWANLEPALAGARELRALLGTQAELNDKLDSMSQFVHSGLACELDPTQLGQIIDDPHLNDSATQAACKRWDALQDEKRGIESRIQANAVHKRINAYAELFSDFVAVLESHSLTAMSDALSLPGLRNNEKFAAMIRLRSFAVCPSVSEARIDRSDPEDHGYFAPARCELGRWVGAANVLQRAFKVFADDLTESVRLDRKKNPIADNERLIQELRKEFL